MPEENNKYQNNLQDSRLEKIEKHIFVINYELGGVQTTQKILILIDVAILSGLIALFLK